MPEGAMNDGGLQWYAQAGCREQYETFYTTEERKERTMGFTATNNGGSFELTPAGLHVGRCCRMIDLGVQETEYQGQKKEAQKIMLSWELIGPDDERMSDGRPFMASKRYTLSMHEKASLRKDLEAWRGKKFSDDEAREFDVSKLLGAYGYLNIVHEVGTNGNDYAKVASLAPLPKSMAKPQPESANILFDMDNKDMAIFNEFSDKLKETLQKAKNWSASLNTAPVAGGGSFDDVTDDVPF